MQFQKISIPIPWKVNGNSEGLGGLKGQNFNRKVWGFGGNSKNLLWEGYGYLLEQHNVAFDLRKFGKYKKLLLNVCDLSF